MSVSQIYSRIHSTYNTEEPFRALSAKFAKILELLPGSRILRCVADFISQPLLSSKYLACDFLVVLSCFPSSSLVWVFCGVLLSS
jgi:hypothetical protein